MIFLLLIASAYFVTDSYGQVPPLLPLEQGYVIGYEQRDWLGERFYAFEGIPYAQPPIGNLRFKAPVPLAKWNGTLNASKPGAACAQRFMDLDVGDENCLYLNVYTKRLNPGRLAQNLTSVLVWFHGGLFHYGTPLQNQPHYLISENITLVTVNYRLGIFGFLNFRDQSLSIPGNAGLKDQLLALKWIHRNIIQFGGNSSQVTVGGIDSGAASAELLMVSPNARGLFQRVLLQSGSSFAYWSHGHYFTYQLAQLLDPNINYTSERLAHHVIQMASLGDLLSAQEKLEPSELLGNQLIGPIVEPIITPEPFLVQSPQEIILSGRFEARPVMTGYTSHEGLSSLLLYRQNPQLFPGNLKVLSQYLPDNLIENLNETEVIAMARRVKDFYYGQEYPSFLNFRKTVKLNGDRAFVYPVLREARLLAEKRAQPVYLYEFAKDTELNVVKQQLQLMDLEGVPHGDDLSYLFPLNVNATIAPGTSNYNHIKTVLQLWANFIDTGNPNTPRRMNVTWSPVTPNRFEYIKITNQGLIPMNNPERLMVNFWDELYRDATVIEQNGNRANVTYVPTSTVKKSASTRLESCLILLLLVFIKNIVC